MFDARTLSAAVAQLAADVVALQEVDWKVSRSWFRDQARLAASVSGHRRLDAPARPLGRYGRYGNAVLYRGRVLDADVVVLPSTGEPRNALIARLDLGAVSATVVATHLQSPSSGRRGEAQDQLDHLLGRLQEWPQPWVVMGDFNLGPDEVHPRFAGAGLVAADSPPTFPTGRPRERIDWIGVRGAEVLAVDVPDVRASDHRPLVADLGFAKDGSGRR